MSDRPTDPSCQDLQPRNARRRRALCAIGGVLGLMGIATAVAAFVRAADPEQIDLFRSPVFRWRFGVAAHSRGHKCRRNGYNNAGTTLLTSFRYSNVSIPGDGTFGWPEANASSSDFRYIRMRFGAPHYFTILPRGHCSDVDLTTCALSSTPTGGFTLPAPVRYCQDSTIANSSSVQSGFRRLAKCQSRLDSSHQMRKSAPLCARISCRRSLPMAAGPMAAMRGPGVHLHAGDDQFRELVRLLPHPHADDEDRVGARVQDPQRELPRRIPHHQPGQPGVGLQVPGDRPVRRRPEADRGTTSSTTNEPGPIDAAARSAGARRTLLTPARAPATPPRAASTAAWTTTRSSIVPAELRDPVHGRPVEHRRRDGGPGLDQRLDPGRQPGLRPSRARRGRLFDGLE